MEVDGNVGVDDSDAGTSNSCSLRLGMCEVCAYHVAKYTCPRCEVKTCSLRCNKIHKLEVECNGERDRAKFIPLNKFSNMDLSSDYKLMEEMSRNLETSRKKLYRMSKNKVTTRMLKLRQEAKARRTDLKFLPYQFGRHRRNSTKFNYKRGLIYWHVDWIFVNADGLKLGESDVAEYMKVYSVLRKYLRKQENKDLQDRLKFYQSADLPGIRVFLKAEQKPGKKFYEVDPTMTFRECLDKKLIIEYPTIHVVLKDHADAYDVIDSDDEDEDTDGQVKCGTEVVNKIVNTAENDDSFLRSLKNLLFVSEYSDEDLSDS